MNVQDQQFSVFLQQKFCPFVVKVLSGKPYMSWIMVSVLQVSSAAFSHIFLLFHHHYWATLALIESNSQDFCVLCYLVWGLDSICFNFPNEVATLACRPGCLVLAFLGISHLLLDQTNVCLFNKKTTTFVKTDYNLPTHSPLIKSSYSFHCKMYLAF